MCRLLGVVSKAPSRLTDTLSDMLEQFTELSGEHADGWGIAAWHDGGLTVVKEAVPAWSSQRYGEATETVTDAAITHIRLATPGLATEPNNTHPFSTGTLAFAHNGFFNPPDAIDELIDPDLLADAGGGTDSERYFLRVLSLLRTGDPVSAIAAAAADIRSRAEFASLNCLLLTKEALYAYTEEDPSSEVSQRRGPEFFRIRYLIEPGRVVVASTGFADSTPASSDRSIRWDVLPHRHVLEIRRSNLRVSVHRFPE
ncbi:class II glutamine amidotransferase [Actinoallomurus vinaceus]|uniref:Class II glutamine amidotransferase n=1 Tax=Actinoallomurus vinaceus TaxID=1080074 RepID=A0ABP8U320_9ACTN